MDNHFNNDETRRVPLPGSESPVPEQFTPEHFDDDRSPKKVWFSIEKARMS